MKASLSSFHVTSGDSGIGGEGGSLLTQFENSWEKYELSDFWRGSLGNKNS